MIDVTYTLIESVSGDSLSAMGGVFKMYSIIKEEVGSRCSKGRINWAFSIKEAIAEAEVRGKRYTITTDDSTSNSKVLAAAGSIKCLKLQFPYEYL